MQGPEALPFIDSTTSNASQQEGAQIAGSSRHASTSTGGPSTPIPLPPKPTAPIRHVITPPPPVANPVQPQAAGLLSPTSADFHGFMVTAAGGDFSPVALASPIVERALNDDEPSPVRSAQGGSPNMGPIARVSRGPKSGNLEAEPSPQGHTSSRPLNMVVPMLQQHHQQPGRHHQDTWDSTPVQQGAQHAQPWHTVGPPSYDPHMLLRQDADEDDKPGSYGNRAYYHPTPPRKGPLASTFAAEQGPIANGSTSSTLPGMPQLPAPAFAKQPAQSSAITAAAQLYELPSTHPVHQQNGTLQVWQGDAGPSYVHASQAGQHQLQHASQAGQQHKPAGRTQRSSSGGAGRRRSELWQLLKLALPCVVITGSAQVVIVASQVVAGHLGTLPLAAVALGNALWLISYYSLIGMFTAFETLGSQAVGSGNLARLVTWGMAAGISSTLLGLPIAGGLWNAGVLMQTLLGQDASTCALVQQYCRALVPGLLPQVWSIVLSKHLQVQSQVLLPAFATGTSCLVYITIAGKMATKSGLTGVALAASIARGYQLLAMLVAVMAYETNKGARWCSSSTWLRGMARWQLAKRGRTLASFLSLGAPGCLGMAVESAGWEVTTAMAAYLGTLQVAVHGSALSLATLVIMCVPMALAIAANIRVAGHVGSGDSHAAQQCAWLVLATGTTVTSLLGVALYVLRDKLGWLFTSEDTDMVEMLSRIAPLVAVYQALGGLLGSTQGCLRGLGRQGTLVVHNTLGLGAGTLLGAWLIWGPRNLGLSGLWAGSVAGSAVTAGLNLVVLLLVEWREEVQVAQAMQAMQQGLRARQRMIARALRADSLGDEVLLESLLDEAQQDPRPLHIVYQEYVWSRGPPTSSVTPSSAARVPHTTHDGTTSTTTIRAAEDGNVAAAAQAMASSPRGEEVPHMQAV